MNSMGTGIGQSPPMGSIGEKSHWVKSKRDQNRAAMGEDESSETGEHGKQFDTSRGRGVLERTIGVGELISGWDEGLIGLCKGAKAILVIPPEMAYGDRGAGGGVIPGGATLRFDVEIVSVAAPPPEPNLFDYLDVDKDGALTPEEIVKHFRAQDPNAELPPGLLEKEDENSDGVVSRDEFGGPRMPWPQCAEMLYRNAEPTALALSVRWLCQRDRERPARDAVSGEAGKDEL